MFKFTDQMVYRLELHLPMNTKTAVECDRLYILMTLYKNYCYTLYSNINIGQKVTKTLTKHCEKCQFFQEIIDHQLQ